MNILLISLPVLLGLPAIVALVIKCSRRSKVTCSGADGRFSVAWSAGQFGYRSDVQRVGCRLRITTEVVDPERFEAENRVSAAPDPARIKTAPRNPALGLPGLLTADISADKILRCKLPVPSLWANRPDSFARLTRTDHEACTKP